MTAFTGVQKMCVCVCVHVYALAHRGTHTHIHTHTHTHMLACIHTYRCENQRARVELDRKHADDLRAKISQVATSEFLYIGMLVELTSILGLF